jgi:ABC-type transport system involved in cytochrome c biogenesis permease subunit
MKFIFCLLLTLSVTSAFAQTATVAVSGEKGLVDVKLQAENIQLEPIRRLMVHQNGRLKPFDTFARETMLFLNGSYSRNGSHPVQTYLSLMITPSAPYADIIEIRDPELRTRLGFLKSKRFYSLADLENSDLSGLAEPLFKKEEENSRAVTESEKKILETFHQMSLMQAVIRGQHLMGAVDFSFLNQTHGAPMEARETSSIQGALQSFLQCLSAPECDQTQSAMTLIELSKQQKIPDLFQHYVDKIPTEIFYNNARPFFWASLLYLVLGIVFCFRPLRQPQRRRWIYGLILLPVFFHVLGLGLRVYITQFAPVTNMYTTMIWVSLGLVFFSSILYRLYHNNFVIAAAMIGSGFMLLLTEQIPLVLSPDLDPIVAVLRSNFWLSTHVTTITISYSAFSIAMLLGNIALIRQWTHKDNENFFREYSHYAYRMIQLGCFLLTVGIILGGVWADYSWGRFWGWDPKETWALIADLGFLSILHARYAGWVKHFTLLALSPIAYLLVIMAWYGVNFILATGLHSYGFSSGGTLAVCIFVGLQLFILILGFLKHAKPGKLMQPKHG